MKTTHEKKVTPTGTTKGRRRRATVFKLADGTPVTAGRVTVQRRSYSPRSRHCKTCGIEFKPSSKSAKYCSEACKAKAYRQRKAAARGDQPREVIVEALTCPHCGLGFYGVRGKGAIFCSPTCRAGAYKTRRKATIAALADDLGISSEDASYTLDERGLTAIVEHLTRRGYLYDYVARRWSEPEQPGSLFDPARRWVYTLHMVKG